MSSAALETPVATIGELMVQIDNLIGEKARLAAKMDDLRLLLIEAKDYAPVDVQMRIAEALAIAPLDRDALLKAQRDLCGSKGYPHFAPSTGICWSCKQDMVDQSWASTLVTGCRRCGKSYCD